MVRRAAGIDVAAPLDRLGQALHHSAALAATSGVERGRLSACCQRGFATIPFPDELE